MSDSCLAVGTLGSALSLLVELCVCIFTPICDRYAIFLLRLNFYQTSCMIFVWCWIFFISPFSPALPPQMPRRAVEVNILFCFCCDYFISTAALLIQPFSCRDGPMRDLCSCGGSHVLGKCSSLGASFFSELNPIKLHWDTKWRGTEEMNRSTDTSPAVLLASLNSTILPSPHCMHRSSHSLHECNCGETGAQFVIKVFLCNKSSGVRNKGRRKLALWQVSHAVSSCFVRGSLLSILLLWTYLEAVSI